MTGSGLECLTLSAIREAYGCGQTTPSALCGEIYERISISNSVFIEIPPLEAVLQRCKEIEGMSEEQRGCLKLYGIPFTVKDNIDVFGSHTTAACPSFSYKSTSSARVVDALLREGAVFMGKTNLDQFACGLVGTRTPYGIPQNAVHKGLVPGGSSSGSAVAVASGYCTFALGTDTAGSGRVPAGVNGIVGIKPSVGLCSTVGVVPACRSLDCPSVFCLNVEDGAEILKIIENDDPYDPTWRPRIAESKGKRLNDGAFRFAMPEEKYLRFDGPGGNLVKTSMHACFRDAQTNLEAIGGTMVEIDFEPFEKIALLLYEGAFVAERYQGIREFLEQDKECAAGTVLDISKDERMLLITRNIIANTRRYSSADVFESMDKLDALRALARRELDKIDALVVPTAAYNYTVKEIVEQEVNGVGTMNANLGRFTNFVNFLGMCGVSVPSGTFESNLSDRVRPEDGDASCVQVPFGVTLLGKAWEDDLIGDIATRFTSNIN